ncbi:hypothetical protein [Dictyobacter kobayashii]|uniref:Uncharacterized protein n=1 Tax=Dictyobacter kobayashii TaxID=2014872 RepID=A0A402ALX4_9CHLR|nr:hypothetical protein [Dictyobacter kobayashii]GCE20113.1 hypothetical protein KDK_39130 [Dictyobacter kobayashii]
MHDTRNTPENDSPAAYAGQQPLDKRLERKKRGHIAALFFLFCGSLVILGGGGVLIWQLTSHNDTSAIYNIPAGKSSAAAKQPAGCTGARQPLDVIQQQTARGMHLTVAQIQARVLAGKTIAQIATQQGLTKTQLRNVEVQALQYANNHWLSMGCITQQDVQANMQRDTGSTVYMDEEFTSWFKG